MCPHACVFMCVRVCVVYTCVCVSPALTGFIWILCMNSNNTLFVCCYLVDVFRAGKKVQRLIYIYVYIFI